ncbi:carbohydrate binding domain-containing protein [Sorangium sp. So ce1151]|uniref:carbohydrate binding domain-containing protein n=1 Tax=Sorangium sp. So ce1151 TaxID=3133332 RepID=UPI003F5EEB8B
MLVSKKIKLRSLAGMFAGCVGLVAAQASAGVVVGKPTPHGNTSYPEAGTTMARAGSFTLVGALQEHVKISGEAEPTFPSTMQGAVYLMNGTSTTPERVYQFPGVAQFNLQAGSQLAIASRFLAFATRGTSSSSSPQANSVYIARNNNGSWAECPLVGGQRNCNGAVRENGQNISRALTRIPLTYPADSSFKDIALALSDDYLVIGYKRHSVLEIYRYNTSTDAWVLELSLDEPDERFTGAAVAIEGDKVAVGSPWSDGGDAGAELGSVRIFRRNASNSTWSSVAITSGYFSSGAFGRSLAMASGNLAVTSGATYPVNGVTPQQHLSFYRVATDGTISAHQSLQTAYPHVHLALYGDTLASTVGGGDEGLSLYKRDATSGQWAYEAGLIRDFYKSVNSSGLGYGGIDPIGLVGDDLALGWRAFSGLLGGVIHEKASLVDACRDPLNLVSNCSFDNVTNTALAGSQSSSGWQLLNWNGASAWADFNGRQMRINVQQPGSDMWHIQARTTVNLPQAGSYRLTFRAKADDVRTFVVNLGRNGNADNNWASYGRVTAAAGPQWVIYSFELPSVPQDAAAFLDFNVGNAGTAAVTVDSVKLVRLAP